VIIHPIEQVQLELCHLTHKRKTETLKNPDFATAPQSLRGAVLKRETERGQNRVSLDAVRDVEFMKPSAAESHLLRSLLERIA
jgi:hypothetical protein